MVAQHSEWRVRDACHILNLFRAGAPYLRLLCAHALPPSFAAILAPRPPHLLKHAIPPMHTSGIRMGSCCAAQTCLRCSACDGMLCSSMLMDAVLGRSTGVFVFGYCVYYFKFKARMTGFMQTAFFFGYMSAVCYGAFLVLGMCGRTHACSR